MKNKSLDFTKKAPEKRTAAIIGVIIAAVIAAAGGLAFLVRGEYVFLGTTSAALFYLLREKGPWRLAGLLPLMVASPWVLLAAPLLLLYSGERGTHGWKYFFYAFYPAHFLVLVWIGDLLQKVL